jgi:hypothetical protein
MVPEEIDRRARPVGGIKRYNEGGTTIALPDQIPQ